MYQIRRNLIIILMVLCTIFLTFYILKYNIYHPVKKLQIEEIGSIQIDNKIYDASKNTGFIHEFLAAYNKARLSKNQELDTTPDFTVIINLNNGETIKIFDGDNSYCYMVYKDKSVIANSPDLIMFFEKYISK